SVLHVSLLSFPTRRSSDLVEGLDALVVMWQDASPMKIAAARGYGAAVDIDAPDKVAAFKRLEQLIDETGRTLVHPYDDPIVMARSEEHTSELQSRGHLVCR